MSSFSLYLRCAREQGRVQNVSWCFVLAAIRQFVGPGSISYLFGINMSVDVEAL